MRYFFNVSKYTNKVSILIVVKDNNTKQKNHWKNNNINRVTNSGFEFLISFRLKWQPATNNNKKINIEFVYKIITRFFFVGGGRENFTLAYRLEGFNRLFVRFMGTKFDIAGSFCTRWIFFIFIINIVTKLYEIIIRTLIVSRGQSEIGIAKPLYFTINNYYILYNVGHYTMERELR